MGAQPTDLVLPSFDLERALEKDATDSLRGRLGTVDTESLIEAEIPQLPSSTDSLASDTTATSLDWFEHELDTSDLAPEIAIAEIDTAASPPANRIASAPHAAPPATVPLEIDELLAASASTPDATNSQTESRVEKPSLVERFAGWSKRLTPGKQTQESKAVSMRLPPEQVENQPISHAQKRSGGILTQWLNRSR